MSKSYAVLPCNGLDKCAGCIAKEVAVMLTESTDSEIICPVFYRVADARYNKLAQEKPLLVIDGCATRCASKLAAEKNLKIVKKVNITEEAKGNDITIGKGLRISENELRLVKILADKLIIEQSTAIRDVNSINFPESLTFETYKINLFSACQRKKVFTLTRMMFGLTLRAIKHVSELLILYRKAYPILCSSALQH
jgi:glycine cleavage system H protein